MNTFSHTREPAPVDKQTVIRLNRDTLHSFAVVDISEGATITAPDAGRRDLSVMVVNEDHYVNRVFHDAGTYDLTVAEFGSPYVVGAARTLVDPRDAADLAAVAAVQDKLAIEAVAARPFVLPEYEPDSFNRTRQALLDLAAEQTSYSRSFGRREDVDPVHHLIGTAAGWGGLPDAEATYVGVAPNLPVGEYELTSVTTYPSTGFGRFLSTTLTGSSSRTIRTLTASTTSPPSGTPTAVSQSALAKGENALSITDGWNYLVRLYRPRPEILNGTWTFPTISR